MQTVPILLYHSVSDEADARYRRWVISPRMFARQIRHLASEGYRPLTVSTFATLLRAGAEIPPRSVLITFDDGLGDFRTGAMPVLDRNGFTATLFVVAGRIGKTSRWLEPCGEGNRTMLTGAELRELADAGIEIGAHSVTHPQLDLLKREEARREIVESRRILEECLGRFVTTFAYPHGYQTPTTRRLVREAGYEAACRVRHALSSPDEDLYALSRVIITEEVDEIELDSLLAGYELPVAPAVDRVASIGWRLARRAMARLPERRPATPTDTETHRGRAMKLILATVVPLVALGSIPAADAQQTTENSIQADELRHNPAIGAALVQLGDLQRSGRVRAADGRQAVDYYRAAARQAPASGIFAVISPEVLVAQAEPEGAPAPAESLAADETYQAAAEMGSTDALLRLGALYRDGELIAADKEKAFEYYMKAADGGSATGQITVAQMMINGEGTPRDVEGGVARLQKAAADGSPEAYLILGDLYARGLGNEIEPDQNSAFDNYLAAAEAGNTRGKIEAGRRLITAEGAARDVEWGVEFLQSAADEGSPEALLVLGDLYENGVPDAVEQDPARAFEIYLRAAEKDSATGRVQIARMLLHGEGVVQDVQRGLAGLEKEASEGSTLAMITLGDLYATGEEGVVEADSDKAYTQYAKAAEAGSATGKLRAGRILLANDQGGSRAAEAVQLLEEAGAAGHSDGYLAIAQYYDGAGPADGADEAKAFEYYQRAAEAGSTTARLAVAERLIRGEGTTRDVAAGVEMLKGVAEQGNPRALLLLGDAYVRGDGGSVNADAAVQAYEQAAALGEADAFVRLGDLYRDGRIVPADGDRAVSYYARAAGVTTAAQ